MGDNKVKFEIIHQTPFAVHSVDKKDFVIRQKGSNEGEVLRPDVLRFDKSVAARQTNFNVGWEERSIWQWILR